MMKFLLLKCDEMFSTININYTFSKSTDACNPYFLTYYQFHVMICINYSSDSLQSGKPVSYIWSSTHLYSGGNIHPTLPIMLIISSYNGCNHNFWQNNVVNQFNPEESLSSENLSSRSPSVSTKCIRIALQETINNRENL